MAENKFLDDIAKFGNSTITAMNGIQRQVRKWVSEQVNELINSMELVKRSELAPYKAKIDALEKRLEQLEASAKAAPKPRTVTTPPKKKAKE